MFGLFFQSMENLLLIHKKFVESKNFEQLFGSLSDLPMTIIDIALSSLMCYLLLNLVFFDESILFMELYIVFIS